MHFKLLPLLATLAYGVFLTLCSPARGAEHTMVSRAAYRPEIVEFASTAGLTLDVAWNTNTSDPNAVKPLDWAGPVSLKLWKGSGAVPHIKPLKEGLKRATGHAVVTFPPNLPPGHDYRISVYTDQDNLLDSLQFWVFDG